MQVLSFFNWLQDSTLGVFMRDRAATFAIIEVIHLLALALLGAAVLTSDLRLLNVVLRDVPSNVVTQSAHRFFKIALFTLLVTGFCMLAGVAVKCYNNPYYWLKMLALAIGIVYAFAIRYPLVKRDHSQINPLTLKLVGAASIMVWFTVAASGRWIGFSG